MNPTSALVERLAPAALGGPFRRILAASVVANLGDGILLAAGPLLAASITSDPLLIALAATAVQLPWVLVSLLAGIVADRAPRVRIMVIASWARAAVLAGLVALIVVQALTMPLLLIALLLLGTAEVFLDTTWLSTVPDAVPSEQLGVANARLSASELVMNELAGPALGGVLFALGHAVPYGATAMTTILAVLALAGLVVPHHAMSADDEAPREEAVWRRRRRELAEGFRWLRSSPPVRTLTIVIFAFNITFGMTWGVLVLYADEVLGLDAAGFGLLMTVSAVGGLLAAGAFGWLERRASYARMMQTLLVIEVLVHVALACSADWIPAAITLFCFGAYSTVWGTLSATIFGRAVPSRMRGRVSSIYLLGSYGGLAIGMPLGGAIAQQAGITAPMWWAAGGTALVLALVWPMLPMIGRAGEARADASAEDPQAAGDKGTARVHPPHS